MQGEKNRRDGIADADAAVENQRRQLRERREETGLRVADCGCNCDWPSRKDERQRKAEASLHLPPQRRFPHRGQG